LGIRYSGDALCPSARFEKLAQIFPQRFYRLDLDGHHHSSLGEDFCEAAFEEVRGYLSQQLKGPRERTRFPALSKLPADFRGPVPCGQMKAHCKA
jgi:hypothetical protein